MPMRGTTIIAALFAAVGIWLGLKITKEKIVVKHIEVAVPAGPFTDRVEGQGVGRDDLVEDAPPVLETVLAVDLQEVHLRHVRQSSPCG